MVDNGWLISWRIMGTRNNFGVLKLHPNEHSMCAQIPNKMELWQAFIVTLSLKIGKGTLEILASASKGSKKWNAYLCNYMFLESYYYFCGHHYYCYWLSLWLWNTILYHISRYYVVVYYDTLCYIICSCVYLLQSYLYSCVCTEMCYGNRKTTTLAMCCESHSYLAAGTLNPWWTSFTWPNQYLLGR